MFEDRNSCVRELNMGHWRCTMMYSNYTFRKYSISRDIRLYFKGPGADCFGWHEFIASSDQQVRSSATVQEANTHSVSWLGLMIKVAIYPTSPKWGRICRTSQRDHEKWEFPAEFVLQFSEGPAGRFPFCLRWASHNAGVRRYRECNWPDKASHLGQSQIHTSYASWTILACDMCVSEINGNAPSCR